MSVPGCRIKVNRFRHNHRAGNGDVPAKFDCPRHIAGSELGILLEKLLQRKGCAAKSKWSEAS